MKYFLLMLLPLFFSACDFTKFDLLDSPSSKEVKSYVEVFTLAPVVDAVLTDANNQVAVYDLNRSLYYFGNRVEYPISAKAVTQTYVDIDYDNNRTAADLNISSAFSPVLKSFCNEINILTSLYYEQNLSEQNISIVEYKNDIEQQFNIDICSNASRSVESAKIMFGAYNYVVSGKKIELLSDIDADVAVVDSFFDNYLSTITEDSDKIKYYSAYNALLNLDLSRVIRVDTIHKPKISSILRESITLQNTNSGIDVFDILPYSNSLYIAAGHDELAKVNVDLSSVEFASSVGLLSFGSRLDIQQYAGVNCLFLANSRVGLTSFEIDSNGFVEDMNISSYMGANNVLTRFTSGAVTNSNHYISLNNNKRLLGISTQNQGYYLINIKDSFSACSPIDNINVSDFIIHENSGSVIDATFRDDGTYLYIGHKGDGIYGYKTDILEQSDVENSKKTFTLKDNDEAYNLKLFNNDNELFVTTNSGVLIYDVGNAVNDLSYVSEYKSEGAQTDYYPYVDSFGDYLFFTDGYKGVKVLKLDNSFHPMLCGVEYFAPAERPYELAKTTSVKYDNGNLYVGITSYGVVKFSLDDILFQHCK